MLLFPGGEKEEEVRVNVVNVRPRAQERASSLFPFHCWSTPSARVRNIINVSYGRPWTLWRGVDHPFHCWSMLSVGAGFSSFLVRNVGIPGPCAGVTVSLLLVDISRFTVGR